MSPALIRTTGCIIGMILAVSQVAAEPKSNFYLPTEKESPAANQETKKAVAPKSKPTPKTTPTPRPEPVKTPEPKPAIQLPKARSAAVKKAFNPALDGFGLAKAFDTRWDFTTFLITGTEELNFRIAAARASVHRIARAFTALASEVDQRQRNLNAAALAAYLLSRDQATWQPVAGPSLTAAQLLAVQATMRQDMQAMDSSLVDYETLRNALNKSAEHLELLEKQGLSASPPNALADEDAYRPTLPLNQVARAQTESVLEERALSEETLKAILATEVLSTTGDSRQSIASFAPPPPVGFPGGTGVTGVGPQMGRHKYTTAERLGLDTAPTTAPGESGPRRRKQSALLLPAGTNAPVLAPKNGVVVFAGPFRGYGTTVIIEHEKGTFSIFSHLGSMQVRERQAIKAGEIIGRAGVLPELGRSGVHFQVRKGTTPLAPEQWLINPQSLVKGR